MANNYEKLLVLLSELGSGTWQTFRRVVEYMGAGADSEASQDFSPYWFSENVAALGHAEFSAGPDSIWTVSPPAIVQVETFDESFEGVLAGARAHELVELAETSEALRAGQEQGPDRLSFCCASKESLEQIAADVEVKFVPHFSRSLARLLPSSPQRLRASQIRTPPTGWTMWRFNEDNLKWDDASSDVSPGFYKYRRFATEYRLRTQTEDLVIDRASGIYEALRLADKSALDYDPLSRIMTVPAIVGLPPLALRAAVLCTGYLPTVKLVGGRYQLEFRGVEESVAEQISTSLS